MTYFLGLTGGIASGKSTVSNLFKELKIPVVDADEIAKNIVNPHTKGWQNVVDLFGTDILSSDETIDRKKLSAIVFNNPDALNRLNKVNDQLIRDAIINDLKLKSQNAKIVIGDIPLLFELNYQNLFDGIMVVDVSPEIQLQRLMKRNNLSEKDAKSRISAQLSLSEKVKHADFVINNSGNIEQTKQQVYDVLKEKFNLDL